MKKIFFVGLLLVLTSTQIYGQEILASTLKIGPFAIDMKKADVEAIALKKIDNKIILKSIEDYKPISVILNGVTFKLSFTEEYEEGKDHTGKFKLYRIACDDSKVKTKSGIAYGMATMDVLQLLYKVDIGFHYSHYKDFDDKGKSTNKWGDNISIYDDKAGRTLYINFTNGKVSGFEVGYSEEGC